MFENPILLLGSATLLAAIPIVIWLYINIKHEKENKKIMFLVFGLGCLTAPALLGLQIFWEKYPEFDLEAFISRTFSSPMTATIMILLLFASMEELIKLYVMRTVDRKTLSITRIGNAMRYCIASALGFSFVENVYYLYSWWPYIGTGELATMYFFRSIFTTASHMVYSGVLGYFYGIGKFSMIINQQKNIIENKRDKLSEFIAKIFNLPPSEGFRQKAVLKGLFIAIGMHFTINFLLELQQQKGIAILLPVVILTNVLMYLFLQYLLKRKTSHLILLTDPTTQRASSMNKKNEDVVTELLGMWFKDKKYVDVIHVCERLLERDPDNPVVKLFKAKAMDEMEDKDIYKKVLGTVLKTDLDDSQKSIVSKYMAEKEMFQKVKQMIKEQLKKMGKEYMEPAVKAAPMIMAPPQQSIQLNTPITPVTPTITPEQTPTITPAPATTPSDTGKKNILSSFTGEGTFKIH